MEAEKGGPPPVWQQAAAQEKKLAEEAAGGGGVAEEKPTGEKHRGAGQRLKESTTTIREATAAISQKEAELELLESSRASPAAVAAAQAEIDRLEEERAGALEENQKAQGDLWASRFRPRREAEKKGPEAAAVPESPPVAEPVKAAASGKAAAPAKEASSVEEASPPPAPEREEPPLPPVPEASQAEDWDQKIEQKEKQVEEINKRLQRLEKRQVSYKERDAFEQVQETEQEMTTLRESRGGVLAEIGDLRDYAAAAAAHLPPPEPQPSVPPPSASIETPTPSPAGKDEEEIRERRIQNLKRDIQELESGEVVDAAKRPGLVEERQAAEEKAAKVALALAEKETALAESRGLFARSRVKKDIAVLNAEREQAVAVVGWYEKETERELTFRKTRLAEAEREKEQGLLTTLEGELTKNKEAQAKAEAAGNEEAKYRATWRLAQIEDTLGDAKQRMAAAEKKLAELEDQRERATFDRLTAQQIERGWATRDRVFQEEALQKKSNLEVEIYLGKEQLNHLRETQADPKEIAAAEGRLVAQQMTLQLIVTEEIIPQASREVLQSLIPDARLIDGQGHSVSGRIVAQMVQVHGLLDKDGGWSLETFFPDEHDPDAMERSGERKHLAEESLSHAWHQEEVGRAVRDWETGAVHQALEGRASKEEADRWAKRGLMSESARQRLATEVSDRYFGYLAQGKSETEARGLIQKDLGEKSASWRGSQEGLVRMRAIAETTKTKDDREAVYGSLFGAWGGLPQGVGEIKAPPKVTLHKAALIGAGEGAVMGVQVNDQFYALQPAFKQSLTEAKKIAQLGKFGQSVDKWSATWQRNPLQASSHLLLGEDITGFLYGQEMYKVLPAPLRAFFEPQVSPGARRFGFTITNMQKEGLARYALERTAGVILGLYKPVPVFKGKNFLGFRYVRVDKYYWGIALDTVLKSPGRIPGGLLERTFGFQKDAAGRFVKFNTALGKFGFAKDFLKIANLLNNPLHGGLVGWGAQLGVAVAAVPVGLAGRALGRAYHQLTWAALTRLRHSEGGRRFLRRMYLVRKFFRDKEFRAKLLQGLFKRFSSFLQQSALGRWAFRIGQSVGKLGARIGQVAAKISGAFKSVGGGIFRGASYFYGLLSGSVKPEQFLYDLLRTAAGAVKSALQKALKNLFSKALQEALKAALMAVKAAVMAALNAVAHALGVSVGWIIAGCACLGCLAVLLIFVIIFLLSGYCMYMPNFVLCRFLRGAPLNISEEHLAVRPAALAVAIPNPPAYVVGDPLAIGGTVLPVTVTNTSLKPVMLSGVTGTMAYITAGGRGGADFAVVKKGDEGLGSFALSSTQFPEAKLDPQSRYISASNLVLKPEEKIELALRISGLRADQDATYVTNLRFLYFEGADSTLPLQETHSFVEIRIGAGVGYGDDLFVLQINSLATFVSSDGTAYRVFPSEGVPECALGIWNPWFNNLQCAVFIEGGQNCAGIKPIFGDAYQWFGIASRREDMAVYTNGAQCPRRGDVIVWEGGSQGWGHVAVVTDDGGLDRYDCSGHVEITQANTPRIKMNLNVYQGWITAEGFEAAGFSLLGLIRRVSF